MIEISPCAIEVGSIIYCMVYSKPDLTCVICNNKSVYGKIGLSSLEIFTWVLSYFNGSLKVGLKYTKASQRNSL